MSQVVTSHMIEIKGGYGQWLVVMTSLCINRGWMYWENIQKYIEKFSDIIVLHILSLCFDHYIRVEDFMLKL